MRLLGPNSLGLVNTRRNFWGTFTASLEAGWPKVGSIGIASQSGAYGAHILTLAVARGLGISTFVTTGNEADITATEAIGWMAEDEHTDVIVAYLEGVSDGTRLITALESARRARKPVIIMKAGRSALGGAAARSHTASLAGDDAVIDAVLREYGALRIHSTQQALDFAEAAMRRTYPVGNTLGVLTVSGGAGVLIADDAEELGLPMPALPEPAQDQIKAKLGFAATRNPVDCTAQALNQIDLIGDFGTTLVELGNYSSLIVFLSHAGGHRSLLPALREQLRRVREAAPECLAAVVVIAPPDIVEIYREDGFLVYDDHARAVAALAAMGRLGDTFARHRDTPPAPIKPGQILASTPNEAEVKVLFGQAGIVVPAEQVVTSAETAIAAAEAIGFPVVMKIVSPDILHKTEIGGVLTEITDGQSVAQGFVTLIERARLARPDARIDGVLVAQKIERGVECFMGINRDPVFGPVAVFGLGGIYVEILKDVVLRPCPFGEAEAREMIGSIRTAALLTGARGQVPVNMNALAAMLSRLSRLAVGLGPKLRAIDVNPVIATSSGAWAVDGVIEIDQSREPARGEAA
jgi:acyl-CoA synthetase (NDP forming)